ncbi:MAG: aldehyde ferredoxin oxidoreductase C-terminal domain-containing protein [Pseudomonadota bacterium]
MRYFLDIDLTNQSCTARDVTGDALVNCGRHLIAETLLEAKVATVDPLSPEAPLIFSAGPLAGSNFSNANRLSIGCKSPLTGGVKEANAGGTFAFNMGQIEIAGLTLHGACDTWQMLYINKDREVSFHSAEHLLGLGNFELAEKLHAEYGKKVSLAICGPVGEYGGLLSGIAFSDTDQRPARLAARGGVGAVMGSKRVKVIVCEGLKFPPFADRKKLIGAVKQYNKWLGESPAIQTFADIGTAVVGDFTNTVGGIPVENFSRGRQEPDEGSTFKLGGDFLREQNLERNGITTHACMPGCQIQCSNVYMDEDGNEVVSPVEYETIGLMGTNCGIREPDELARVNWIANDLGVDTIETGAMLAVLMDAGLAAFGDVDFMAKVMDEDLRCGTEEGKLWAQGTGAVGRHYGVKRVPVIKNQAISAYDPRVIEVTGLSMMMTAQGADHTAGNLPTYECFDKSLDHLVEKSVEMQILCAAADSLGLCIFGRSVTNEQIEFMVNTLNDAFALSLDTAFFVEIGKRTLQMEHAFNRAAGFAVEDDELPSFFYTDSLEPANRTARFHANEVDASPARWAS